MTTKEIIAVKELLSKPIPYELIDMNRWIEEAKVMLIAIVTAEQTTDRSKK